MTSFVTVRPISAPYVTTSLDTTGLTASPRDTSGAIAPTLGGDGSWNDDQDATFVDMPATPATQTTALVAADFAAIPNVVTATYPRFGMMMRVTVTADDPADLDPLNCDVPLGIFSRGGTGWSSVATPFPLGTVISTPTTYTTAVDRYILFDGLEEVRTQGFTVAVAMQWQAPMAGTVDLTVFELAVTFEVVDGLLAVPAMRQVQRGDGYGIGGVPRAVSSRTRQASLRSGPGAIL